MVGARKGWLVAALLGLSSLVFGPGVASAQEVSPRWTLMGRGLLSSKLQISHDKDVEPDWTLTSFSDTEINSRVDQVLFGDVFGMFVLGARLTDLESPIGPVFLHHVAGEVIDESWVVTAGRTRRLVSGPSYPTLRSEDMLTFLQPLNAYSAGALDEDALFAETLALTLRQNFRWHAQIGIETLRNTVSTGDPAKRGEFEPNGALLKLFYRELDGLHTVNRFHYAGVGFFAQKDEGLSAVGDEVNMQARADVALAPYPDPIHLFDLRLTGLYQHGLEPAALDSGTASWQSRYVSGALGLRYLYRPYQLERFQAGLTGGYRYLTEFETSELRGIASVFYPLGVGVDLGLQYIFSHREQALAEALDAPQDAHRVELAFVYNFDVRVNDAFTTPETILNLLHDYVPVY